LDWDARGVVKLYLSAAAGVVIAMMSSLDSTAAASARCSQGHGDGWSPMVQGHGRHGLGICYLCQRCFLACRFSNAARTEHHHLQRGVFQLGWWICRCVGYGCLDGCVAVWRCAWMPSGCPGAWMCPPVSSRYCPSSTPTSVCAGALGVVFVVRAQRRQIDLLAV